MTKVGVLLPCLGCGGASSLHLLCAGSHAAQQLAHAALMVEQHLQAFAAASGRTLAERAEQVGRQDVHATSASSFASRSMHDSPWCSQEVQRLESELRRAVRNLHKKALLYDHSAENQGCLINHPRLIHACPCPISCRCVISCHCLVSDACCERANSHLLTQQPAQCPCRIS